MNVLKIISVLFLLFSISGCVKNNPAPAFIQIDKWELEANPSLNLEEGVLTHALTDAWVYIDDKIIGVFELPVKIPVLVTGNKTIRIFPAIRKNGIRDTKTIYPFCESVSVPVNLVQNETVTISPKTRYFSNTKFYWKEEFEDVGFSFETDPVSNGTIIRKTNSPEVKYGSGCGFISLNKNSDSLWIGYTNKQLVLPKSGAEVYLEIDFKTNNNILTGVLGINSFEIKQNPFIQLNKDQNGEWRKIYLDLKEIVSNSTSAEYFEIYLRALIDPENTTGEIYIDNLKILFF